MLLMITDIHIILSTDIHIILSGEPGEYVHTRRGEVWT
eukprot:SAG22_NODE_10296_length_542_cov_1.936795_1_plen_37_part_10